MPPSRRISRLTADIALLDERLVEIVATNAAVIHRYQLPTSMPGIGAALACTLVAFLPELVAKPVNLIPPSSAALHPSPAPG